MLAKIFKAYDVRGVYPKPLNERLAWQIGFAAAQHLLERADRDGRDDPMSRALVVGRDMRRSSPALAEALKAGMKAASANVMDVGMVDTPFVGFAVRHLGAGGGVQVTASHNPAEYNGFKFCGPGAVPIGAESGLMEIQRRAALVERGRTDQPEGVEEARDLWEAYREHLLQFAPPGLASGQRTVHVVVDASNGMAGTMVPQVFGGLKGLKITALHFDNARGEFVHEPNPLEPENLRWVSRAVQEQGADFGVCFDGDADRCMVVDETGVPVGCDVLTAWLAQGWLKREKGAAIVYDLRSTRALPESIKATGGRPVECRVGHVFMKAAVRQVGAPFGGELSGHFYYRDMGCTDNGARALLDVLQCYLAAGKPMAACVAPFRAYVQSGELNFTVEDKDAVLARLRAAFPRAKVQMLDGLSMDCGDWWCNVRPSNTEPLLRVNAEARDPATLQRALAQLRPHLQ